MRFWVSCSKVAKLSKKLGDMRAQGLTPDENAAIIAALFTVQAHEKIIARRMVAWQLASVLIVAGVVYSVEGAPQNVIAVLSGGAVSVLNGMLLAWRMSPPISSPAHEAHHQLRLMYFYTIERYLVVVVLLCLCFAVLKFAPLAILGGFVIGQSVLLATRLFFGK